MATSDLPTFVTVAAAIVEILHSRWMHCAFDETTLLFYSLPCCFCCTFLALQYTHVLVCVCVCINSSMFVLAYINWAPVLANGLHSSVVAYKCMCVYMCAYKQQQSHQNAWKILIENLFAFWRSRDWCATFDCNIDLNKHMCTYVYVHVSGFLYNSRMDLCQTK